jgi:hypothetical protein
LIIHRGDTVALSNGSRTLTTLHVAHLQVNMTGDQTVLDSGTCQAGQYYGPPVSTAPINGSAGVPTNATTGGTALTGEICPLNGSAAGLPSSPIVQTDETSGGQTMTEVPDLVDTSPSAGANVYGSFVARATTGLAGPGNTITSTDSNSTVSLSIAPAAGGAAVYTIGNVDKTGGVSVTGLKRGGYIATWTITDANGDTRVDTTRFIEEVTTSPKVAKPKITCTASGGKLKCGITFGKPTTGAKTITGSVTVSVSEGRFVVARGSGKVKKGKVTVSMRQLRHVTAGVIRLTVVLSQPGLGNATMTFSLRVG